MIIIIIFIIVIMMMIIITLIAPQQPKKATKKTIQPTTIMKTGVLKKLSPRKSRYSLTKIIEFSFMISPTKLNLPLNDTS